MRVTAVLNSCIISSVMSFCETPFAVARDFARLPRWSMAAAAMMPSLLDSAFMCCSLPGERLTRNAPCFSKLKLSHAMLCQPAVEAVRDSYVPQNLYFKEIGSFELTLVP